MTSEEFSEPPVGKKHSPTLRETKKRRRAKVDRWGAWPYQIGPVLRAIREAGIDGSVKVARAIRINFPAVGKDASDALAMVALTGRKWWRRVVVGHEDCDHADPSVVRCVATTPTERCSCACHATSHASFTEGRDSALANAAMVAHDFGHPDIRHKINQLIPEGSPNRPRDTPPGSPYDTHPMSVVDGTA